MTEALPQIKHVYQNHHLDSTRWEKFQVRDDDIIIATPYKSGTTWMQNIVRHLVFLEQPTLPAPTDVSPWLDNRLFPIEDILSRLEAQEHRRFMKTHLPLDGLPFHQKAKYIVIGRDARDVFMSLWNHYRNYTPEFIKLMNEDAPGLVGSPFPPCPVDIGSLWYMWMTRGWFEWEREGYPFWSNISHVQTWWDFRSLPNILFVHFADLLEDPSGEIARVAKFLDIAASDQQVESIVEATSFQSMKEKAEDFAPAGGRAWVGGAQTFMNQGTNGRWKNVLVPEDLSLYHESASRILSPSCQQWLENGRLASA